MQFSERQANRMMIIALMVIPLSGFAVDIFVPSLPALQHYFGISESLTQLTVTIFLISYGICQFFTGNIVDAYGRRKTSIISLFCFAIFSFMTPFSHGLIELLVLRFMQGLCVGFFVVAKRAIVVDLFSGSKLAGWVAYMSVAWSIGPIIAPGIGGYLQTYFGWESSFYFLGAYALIVMLLEFFFVAETAKEFKKINTTGLITVYREILSSKIFMLALLCTGLCYGMVMLFNLLGAFLLQSHMGYSPIQYGHYALIMGFGWTVGGLSNRRFLHTNFYKKVKIASILAIIIAATMFGLGLIATNIWLIIIPALLMHCCAGFIFNNYFAFCLSVFPQHAGTSGGVQGSGNYLITFAVSAILAAILPSNTPLSLAGGYLGLAILCLIVFYFILRLPPIKMSKTVDLGPGH